MTPEEKIKMDLLVTTVSTLTKAFNDFVDVYARTVFIDKMVPLAKCYFYSNEEGTNRVRLGL